MTLNKKQRILITIGAGVIGGGMGFVLSHNAGTTQRERVLSTVLGATAIVGVTHSVLNFIASTENDT